MKRAFSILLIASWVFGLAPLAAADLQVVATPTLTLITNNAPLANRAGLDTVILGRNSNNRDTELGFENDPEEVQSGKPNEAIEKLKNSKDSVLELSRKIQRMWDEGKTRAQLLALVKDESLATNVLLGVATVLARENERSAIELLLRVGSGPKFRDQEQRDLMLLFVLMPYHEKESIFPAVDDAIAKQANDFGGFCQLLELVPKLIAGGGRSDVDRFEAILGLVRLWELRANDINVEVLGQLKIQLVDLTDGVYSDDSPEGWSMWLKSFQVPGVDPPSLSLVDIYREKLTSVKAKLSNLAIERRGEVTQLIARVVAAGELPVDFLLKEDAEIRQMALNAIKSSLGGLPPEVQAQALDQLVAALEEPKGIKSAGLFRDVLSAAGDLAAGSQDVKRKQKLASLIFGDRWLLDPLVAQTRLRVVLKIGNLPDAKAAAGIYKLASAEERVAEPEWVEVRSLAVESVAVLSQEPDATSLELILRALSDPASRVRGIAASTCGVLSGKFGPDAANPLPILLARAKVEKNAVTRRRILAAARQISDAQPELLLPSSGTDLVATFAQKDLETKRAVVGLSLRLLANEKLSVKERAELLGLLKAALAENGGSPLAGLTALDMAKRYQASMRGLLREWSRKTKNPSPEWVQVKTILLAESPDKLELGWELAQDAASHQSPVWLDEALALGIPILEKTKLLPAENNPWRARLAACEAELLTWYEGSLKLEANLTALALLKVQLERKPNDAHLLFRLARLEARHSKGDDAAFAKASLDLALGHYRLLLSPKSVGGNDESRLIWIRSFIVLLAENRMYEELQVLAAGMESTEKLEEAESLMVARALFFGPNSGLQRMGPILARVANSTSPKIKSERSWLLAAFHLANPELLNLESARQQLEAPIENPSALMTALRKRLLAMDQLTKALGTWATAGQEARAKLELKVSKGAEVSVLLIVGNLLKTESVTEVTAWQFTVAKKLLVSDPIWKTLELPPKATPVQWKALVAKIRAWNGSRLPDAALRKMLR